MRTDFRHHNYEHHTPTKGIKFKAAWPDAGSYGLIKIREVVFELGLGPCGKHVLHLDHTITHELLTITQTARNPDDLKFQHSDELLSLLHKKTVHTDACHKIRMEVAKHPKEIDVGSWWRGSQIVPLTIDVSHIKGKLEADQLAALEFRIEEIKKLHAEWRDRIEIKTFTYKMTDVHGRIEALR